MEPHMIDNELHSYFFMIIINHGVFILLTGKQNMFYSFCVKSIKSGFIDHV